MLCPWCTSLPCSYHNEEVALPDKAFPTTATPVPSSPRRRREDVEDALEVYSRSVRRTERAAINAGACGTKRDYDAYHRAQDAEGEALDTCIKAVLKAAG